MLIVRIMSHSQRLGSPQVLKISQFQARLSNGSVGANFVLRITQNLLRGTCSENGLGANQSKYLLQSAPSSKSLDLSK